MNTDWQALPKHIAELVARPVIGSQRNTANGVQYKLADSRNGKGVGIIGREPLEVAAARYVMNNCKTETRRYTDPSTGLWCRVDVLDRQDVGDRTRFLVWDGYDGPFWTGAETLGELL